MKLWPSKRAWKWIRRVSATLLMLVVLTAVGSEGIRQQRITEAQQKHQAAVEGLLASWEHVDDWEGWYRQRTPANEGCAEFRDWYDGHGGNNGLDYLGHVDVDNAANDGVLTPKENAVVDEFMAESSELVRDAGRLLRYETVLGVPAVEDGIAHFESPKPVLAVSNLLTRLRVLALREQWDEHDYELSVMCELVARMKSPASLSDHQLALSMRSLAIRQVAERVARHPIADDLGDTANRVLAMEKTSWRHVVEGELAYQAQMWSVIKNDGEHPLHVITDYDAWFGWFEIGPKPKKLLKHRDEPALENTHRAAFYDELLRLYESGEEFAFDDFNQEALAAVQYHGIRALERKVDLHSEFAGVVFSVRQAEGEGGSLQTLRLDEYSTANVKLVRRDGGLLVEFSLNDLTSDALHAESEEDLTERFQPILIEPRS